MSIHDYNIANQTFPATRSDINDVLGAIVTNNSNASAPTTTFAYMWWYDTANNILKQRNGANNAWINIGSYDQTNGLFNPAGTPLTSAKTGAYTVVLADRNSVILSDATSAAFTVTLPAAATAGAGFMVTVKKTDASANAVTLDANASETIDGALTFALTGQYDTAQIVCNGTAWFILNREKTFTSTERGLAPPTGTPAGNFLKDDGTWAAPSASYTLATAQATTSGTSIDFTSIPSTVNRIRMLFSGVSTSGGSNLLVQIGDSGGIENTGYNSTGTVLSSGVATSTNTAGYIIYDNSAGASDVRRGIVFIDRISGNNWVFSGLVGVNNASRNSVGTSDKTLTATLDRVRLTTVNGTDTFDAGSVTISYE